MTVPLNPSADGLNIDPDFGVISGTPAEDAIQSAPDVVTVTMDDGDGGSTTQTFDWTVNDSTMTIQGDAISQQAGAGVDTFPVAAFTDPDLNRQASDYATTINWGDGQTSQGEVDGGNGAYTVSGDHVYLHPGAWALQVTVTDPAGGTATAATAATTASVTPAPLTATGNLQDGATSGLATTFTVATFSDANGYAAASSYTATINRGDGTATTTGVIDGADGAFRVTGNHSYAYDGTYSVSVTVTDADGATTTTTSQITAGDIQAGLDNTLTVASFTSADPNATAASFTAMIQWGDGGIMMGGTAGTVVQEGNQFVVLGAHAFQAAGVYTVQVTVTDLSGDQLTGSDTVQAAPAPAMGFGGDLAAQDGYVSDAALALFTLPQGYGALGQYTATADWGDGTSSAVSLANNGGIWEALGDHGYSGPGQYAVKTLVYNAALQVVAAAVSLVEADAPAEIVGPAAVPGNSVYRYVVTIPATAANKIKDNFPSTTDGFSVSAGASRVRSGYHQNAMGKYDYFWADIQFDNKPAVVNVTLAKWLKGETGIAATLPVTVVQVVVASPDDPANPGKTLNPFETSAQSVDRGNTTAKTNPNPQPTATFDGKVVNTPLKQLGSTTGFDQEFTVPGIAYKAKVTLIGVGANHKDGVDKIAMGFEQYAQIATMDLVFPGKKVYSATLESLNDKAYNITNWYLDSGDPANMRKAWPFVTRAASALFQGNPQQAQKTIIASDIPYFNIPLKSPTKTVLEEVALQWNFRLAVVAMATDAPTAADGAFLLNREATAEWSWNASSSKIDDNADEALISWVGTKAAVVSAPNQWTIAATPDQDKADKNLLYFNQLLPDITWKS